MLWLNANGVMVIYGLSYCGISCNTGETYWVKVSEALRICRGVMLPYID